MKKDDTNTGLEVKGAHSADPSSPVVVDTKVEANTDKQGKATYTLPTREQYEKSKEPEAWNKTAAGRALIRSVSRGFFGAVAITMGGLWTRNLMKSSPYHAETPLLKQKNPLQFIAKLIDVGVGTPIRAAVTKLTGDEVKGLNAVHFKPTKYERKYSDFAHPVRGRSLGEEAVFTTFDFFCASVGDAFGRDVMGWIDPVQRKERMEHLTDEHGSFKWGEATKSLLKRAWRYVSYNGGEDWAVAIPYVYFVKHQRNFIDKHISPGYGFESDVGLNASSLKMQLNSNPHRVAGSYSFEAMLDYQTRFTAYNIGTLMYRELYDKVAKAWNGEHVNLYGTPDAPPDPNKGIVGHAVDTLKWTARSIIKGAIYMTPSMPFFSLTRVTQGRDRALFVDPDTRSALAFTADDGKPHFVTASHIDTGEDGIKRSSKVHYARYDAHARGGLGQIVNSSPSMDAWKANPSAAPGFDQYKKRHNLIENMFSSIGSMGSKAARSLDGWTAEIDRQGRYTTAKKILGLQPSDKSQRFTRNMINAAVSYTPYMYAKAEFANLWDTGKMDMAAERLVDGMFSGSLSEMREGAGEIWSEFLHKPFADKEREAEGERRNQIDSSASDSFNLEEAQRLTQRRQESEKRRFTTMLPLDHDPQATHQSRVPQPAASNLPWQERTLKGQPEEGEAKVVSTKHSPQTHAGREEMRKVLEDITPPSSSIH